ncbi:MAG: tRNA (N(6)-L-threonylcarbamoyladenosine(37)-C(2))-methylthiotransferase [Pyrobaculum sp.]|uniref:tRNA-t(6)A37 methylthiotransferase n=2 Tax=Pyrobaculum arsenaticum TaxID=121277 RepID=A4WKG1_PYRAR|nr:tRNA (N(6)-L-threonylcarbamoyladenosine(37)-C(2))-methylthiotransferase [Pyrobaculum arsenaticum]ABP50878.1 RNA modification enzyme, MiaB family [Pyrobaculum arsenaticum DSM 13514]MCY0891334.1 tRNA (N(6)-L-threonylcarbamoyladenosine(37)-C(2))-methylthiotransferase [Pyrobaculum arsenaticum]NYR15403.1 tRNA (N(6)-L-threonylcarbamoyladenosine(37)-C(2))-methylthiotransferase [Pyrobaculum arsenaticum]
MARAYIETYGCWLAKADAEIIRQRLGLVAVERPEDADVVMIYTCAVREDGEVRQLARIRELAGLRKEVVVAGCLAKLRPYTIKSAAPNARLLYPSEVEGGQKREMKVLPRYEGGVIYTVPLQVGCLGNCTFCATKYTRGGAGYVKSANPDDVVRHVKEAVARGAKEIYLTGQDVITYGFDMRWRPGWSLPDLLERILREVEGEYRVRIGMSEPWVFARFADRLLDIVKGDRRVYRYFHLPVQSGSDRVLRAMGRRYTVDEYRELVRKIRKTLGEFAFVATDIIVGFPGEAEDDFWESVKLVEELQLDKVHVARFSPRPFTEAAVMPRQVPDAEKKRRSKILSEVSLRVARLRNGLRVGSRDVVLIDEVDHGLVVGRASDYRQVVVKRGHGDGLIGQYREVQIVAAGAVYLYGDIVE